MKTGIIGLGKMGGALLRGMLKAGAVSPEEVWVYDHHHENVQALQQEYPGVHEAATEADAADAVEALILAVKPHGVLSLISSLSERREELPLLISIAAAISLDDMEACASDGTRIVRAMPNTPCMVLAGVIAYSTGAAVTDEDEEAARRLRWRACHPKTDIQGHDHPDQAMGMILYGLRVAGPPTCLRCWTLFRTPA